MLIVVYSLFGRAYQ